MKDVGVKGTLYMLRHTYATNLYYLGVPDKERQVYMGHYSSALTNDIYTTFDPSIKKSDIVKLYNNLYPEFWHQFWHQFFFRFWFFGIKNLYGANCTKIRIS